MLENPPAGVKAPALSVVHWCLTSVVMAWVLHRSPAAPHSTLFDDVTGSDRRHCRYGLPQKPLHTVLASAQKETPSQVPLTQLFSKRELDKSHSFFCDILLRLFWSQPSMAFLQRAGATSFSFLRVIQDTQQTLWSTAQWPRKKTRRTMSFAHTHIQRHAHYASPPFGHVLHSTNASKSQRKLGFLSYKKALQYNFNTLNIF